MQDFVSMALLWFATEETDAGSATIQQEQALTQIRTVEQWLDQALND